VKIGIDAKWFYKGPPSGKNVVKNVVENIINQNIDNELFIFLDSSMKDNLFDFECSNVKLVYVWSNNNLISNVFLVPIIAWKLKLDCMIFQNFVPFYINCKTISFVYDVIFLSHPQYFTLKERIYLYPIKLLSHFASRICTISHSEKNRISSNCRISKDKIDVVHIGVSSSFKTRENFSQEMLHKVRERYGLPEAFLLYVGRLNERKNIFNTLKAVSLLKDYSIPLVLVGSYDWKMFDIEQVLHEMQIADRVKLVGFVSDEDLPLVYSLATVFLFVSFEEGFGLPPLEAMAAGVPVVVSDRSSLPEVCGEAGTYANPDCPQSIADAIVCLLSDCSMYHQKTNLGLSRAHQFTWDLTARNLIHCATDVALRG